MYFYDQLKLVVTATGGGENHIPPHRGVGGHGGGTPRARVRPLDFEPIQGKR